MSRESSARLAHPPTQPVDCQTEEEVRRVLDAGGVATMPRPLADEFGADFDDDLGPADMDELLAGDGMLVDRGGGFAGSVDD